MPPELLLTAALAGVVALAALLLWGIEGVGRAWRGAGYSRRAQGLSRAEAWFLLLAAFWFACAMAAKSPFQLHHEYPLKVCLRQGAGWAALLAIGLFLGLLLGAALAREARRRPGGGRPGARRAVSRLAAGELALGAFLALLFLANRLPGEPGPGDAGWYRWLRFLIEDRALQAALCFWPAGLLLGALCLRPRRPAADGAAEPPSRLERLFFRKPAGQPAAPAGETPAGQSDPLALILAAAALAVLAGSGFLQGLGVSRWWRNEYRARETLRVIQAAEEQYLAAAGRYGALAALALGALEQPGFNAPGGGTRSGYAFHCAPAAAGRAFVARAAPLEPGITGRYWFYLDESGVLRAAEQPRVDAGSPPAE